MACSCCRAPPCQETETRQEPPTPRAPVILTEAEKAAVRLIRMGILGRGRVWLTPDQAAAYERDLRLIGFPARPIKTIDTILEDELVELFEEKCKIQS